MSSGESDAQGPGNSVRLRQIFHAPPERVYRAFLDPDAMAKWSAPHGFTGRVHEIDVREGGGYKMSFTSFSTGEEHSFGGRFVELVPHERIRYTDAFDDPNLEGDIQVTIELREVMNGTDVTITQEGLPEEIPTEFVRAGWQESLQLLAYLVEPENPSAGGPE